MGTGLHGENGLDPETSISLLKTYILPILTYGLEIVIPKGQILDGIQNYNKKPFRQVLSLAVNVADPAVLAVILMFQDLGHFRHVIQYPLDCM
jgi:hypothetical protein